MQIFLLLSLLIIQTEAGGLSSNLGTGISYCFIILIILIFLSTTILTFFRPQYKGAILTSTRLVIFFKFAQYSTYTTLEVSTFYFHFWKIFKLTQNDLGIIQCDSNDSTADTRFLCNSLLKLFLIVSIMVILAILKLIDKKQNNRIADFFVGIVYCLAPDLCFYAFLDLYNVKFKQLNFDSSLRIIGTIFAILCLFAIYSLILYQFFLLYRKNKDSWAIRAICEEFTIELPHYECYYYILILIGNTLYSFFLVFATSKAFVAPISMTIVMLIFLSYIFAFRPFQLNLNNVIAVILTCVEMILLFVPVLYNSKSTLYWLIDAIALTLLSTGLLLTSFKIYYGIKTAKSSLAAVNVEPNTTKVEVFEDSNSSISNSRANDDEFSNKLDLAPVLEDNQDFKFEIKPMYNLYSQPASEKMKIKPFFNDKSKELSLGDDKIKTSKQNTLENNGTQDGVRKTQKFKTEYNRNPERTPSLISRIGPQPNESIGIIRARGDPRHPSLEKSRLDLNSFTVRSRRDLS